MSSTTTTTVRRPVIDAHNGKIGVIERRIEYLKRKLERNVNYYAESESADFDRSEITALKAAIIALEFHRDTEPPSKTN